MSVPAKLILKVNDLQPYLYAQAVDPSGDVIDITDATIRFTMVSVDTYGTRTIIVDRSTIGLVITDAVNGKFKWEWQSGDTAIVGRYLAEFEVTPSGDSAVDQGKFTLPPDDSLVVVIKTALDAS